MNDVCSKCAEFAAIYCYLLIFAIIDSCDGSKMRLRIHQSEFKVHDPSTCDDVK